MYFYRIVVDDMDEVKKKMEEEQAKGRLFGQGKIEILEPVVQEQRIYLGFMRSIIVVLVQYKLHNVEDPPLFETADGDLM